MHSFFPMIAALPDLLPGALSMVAAVVVSFAIITAIASYYRFQHIVQQAEDTQPEDMGVSSSDILRVQLARFLASCGRRGTSFSLALIRVDNPSVEVRMGDSFIEAIKSAARHDDITCIFDGQTAALLAESEPEDSEAIFVRITRTVAAICPEVSAESLRVGISSYPGHGLSGKELIEGAGKGLEQADELRPVFMPEIIEHEEEADEDLEEEVPVEDEIAPEEDAENEDDSEKNSSGWMSRRKSAMLDELTGVLKPSAVSAYMQRMMNDLRHKKAKAALFCIGVNNMDHITRFHGEEAADDVLAGISKILQESVRSDDLIGRHEKHAFLILAQISLADAEIIGKRISTIISQREIISDAIKLKTTVTLGVAAYPEHGRNLHTLYRAGQKVLDHSRANDIRAYAVYDPEIHDSMPSKPMKNIKSIQA
jgi:diguanylate cyclase (GGDEF)-like protein